MGPQLDSCGRANRRPFPLFSRAVLQWGRNLTVAEGIMNAAIKRALSKLQWGRNLTVAEGYANDRRLWPCEGVASMGPQLDSCGRGRRRPDSSSPRRGPLASMGPQLDSCGRCHPAAFRTARGALQWGRNLTVAEGSHGEVTLAFLFIASMGPQLDSCGRRHRLAERVFELELASMGPQLDSCGRSTAQIWAHRICRDSLASMGPQLDSCGRRRDECRRRRQGGSFNGAAT